MKRSEQMAERLARYGNPVTVQPKHSSPMTVSAIIQPMSIRRMPDSESLDLVGGNSDRDGMLYLGPTTCRLDQFVYGTTITAGNICYRVVRAECVCSNGAPIYVWAMLQKIVE